MKATSTDSPYEQVLMHPPLVGNITRFCPLYELDATCREIKDARKGFVYYNLNRYGTTWFMKLPYFRIQLMKRMEDMKRVRVSASFKGTPNNDAETFVTRCRLEAIEEADDIQLYLRDRHNYNEFTRERVWTNVTELTVSRYPDQLTSIYITFPNLRRLLIRVAENFNLTPLNFLPSLEYLEIDCAAKRPSSVCGSLIGFPNFLTKLSHITLDHFPASTDKFSNLQSVRTLEMHAKDEFTIDSSTINNSFPNLRRVIQRPHRDFSSFRVCNNLSEIVTSPNSVDSFPCEFDEMITKLILIKWLSRDDMPEKVISRIARMQALEELIFHYSASADFAFIGNLKNLKLLDVRKCAEINLGFVKDLPKLEVLKVYSLTEDVLELIKGLKLQQVVADTQPTTQVLEMARAFAVNLKVDCVEKEIVTFPSFDPW